MAHLSVDNGSWQPLRAIGKWRTRPMARGEATRPFVAGAPNSRWHLRTPQATTTASTAKWSSVTPIVLTGIGRLNQLK
jgi:hypothetical protein